MMKRVMGLMAGLMLGMLISSAQAERAIASPDCPYCYVIGMQSPFPQVMSLQGQMSQVLANWDYGQEFAGPNYRIEPNLVWPELSAQRPMFDFL